MYLIIITILFQEFIMSMMNCEVSRLSIVITPGLKVIFPRGRAPVHLDLDPTHRLRMRKK